MFFSLCLLVFPHISIKSELLQLICLQSLVIDSGLFGLSCYIRQQSRERLSSRCSFKALDSLLIATQYGQHSAVLHQLLHVSGFNHVNQDKKAAMRRDLFFRPVIVILLYYIIIQKDIILPNTKQLYSQRLLPNLSANISHQQFIVPLVGAMGSLCKSTHIMFSVILHSIVYKNNITQQCYVCTVYKSLPKNDINLKAMILKTTQSSSINLNSLGVEHRKFIMGPISLVFNLCTVSQPW